MAKSGLTAIKSRGNAFGTAGSVGSVVAASAIDTVSTDLQINGSVTVASSEITVGVATSSTSDCSLENEMRVCPGGWCVRVADPCPQSGLFTAHGDGGVDVGSGTGNLTLIGDNVQLSAVETGVVSGASGVTATSSTGQVVMQATTGSVSVSGANGASVESPADDVFVSSGSGDVRLAGRGVRATGSNQLELTSDVDVEVDASAAPIQCTNEWDYLGPF